VSGPEKFSPSLFAKNPVGIVMGDTVYARALDIVIPGPGLRFNCSIEEGTLVHLLKRGDIIANARKSLEDARQYLPNIQGAILFNCVLRYLELQELKKTAEFNQVFDGLNFTGFNTYGEEYFTHHNQTLTAVFFGG
ncbi:MAG: FIST C-terminal domain-containing protein, partial [Treponema sp.]|nr:FIST C-terminal domain-containing protein [Treponema sp.]